MASYFWMHLKVLFWQFYFKGELIIHRERNVASSEYTNKYYSIKCQGNLGFCWNWLRSWFGWFNRRFVCWVFLLKTMKTNMKTKMKKTFRWVHLIIINFMRIIFVQESDSAKDTNVEMLKKYNAHPQKRKTPKKKSMRPSL